jgi:hypothetical protein
LTLQQKHPDRKNDLFTHLLPFINVWLGKELSTIAVRDHQALMTELFFASATLVDFPQFHDIHHLIPQVLDLKTTHTMSLDYHQIEDPGKWKIYVKYRQIVSRFLTDWTRSGSLFVGQSSYVGLAKYLTLFLTENME